jgi:hypothetical protein
MVSSLFSYGYRIGSVRVKKIKVDCLRMFSSEVLDTLLGKLVGLLVILESPNM